MRFILTATRETDNSRLHLIQRDVEYCQYVVCWNYSTKNNSWDWGTYCDGLKDALTAFTEKLVEYGFNDVFEGLKE